MTGRMAGKAAIVSGAGQTPGSTIGNGRATAVLLAREGARVWCADRVLDRAEETAAAIRDEGGEAHAVHLDVTDAAQVATTVQAAHEQLGRIDVLVNNVGIGGGGDGPIQRVTDDAFDRILMVNLTGTMLLTRAVVRVMREQRSGSIVNVSSLAARAGGGQVAYEVSKAAVNRLTTSVAQSQARHGIRCNAVQPGLMDTPMAVAGIARMLGRDEADVRAERDAQVPLGGRMGTAWDTAYAVLYLASDESRFVSGAIIPVDGAMGVIQAGGA
jgi:NAD(P)-dependent dehydrogenase (short-subunit alcohol dehydrogenase family)